MKDCLTKTNDYNGINIDWTIKMHEFMHLTCFEWIYKIYHYQRINPIYTLIHANRKLFLLSDAISFVMFI